MNVKKLFVLLFCLSIFLGLFNGCKKGVENSIPYLIVDTPPPSDNSIPFLTFSINQKENYVEAYLNYWDLTKGNIIQINKVLYIVTAPPDPTGDPNILDWMGPVQHYGPPLSWDGESYIYLSSIVHKLENIPSYLKLKMFDDPIDPCKYFHGKIIEEYDFFAYSKNLQVQIKNDDADYRNLKKKYGTFTFRVFNDDSKKVIEKKIKISLYNDIFHGAIYEGEAYLYNENKKEVKALHLYYDNQGAGHFLICSINLEKGTYEWHEVSGIGGCIPNMGPEEVSIIDGKFYVPLCSCYIGIIDPDNYTCKYLDQQDIFKSLSFYNSKIYCGGYPSIPGEYKDFLILNGTIDYGAKEGEITSENYRHLWIAYNTKTNDIAGILEWNHLEPQFILVKDKNGRELSRVETDKLIKDISKVYDINKEPYMNGYFLYINCIRFPHKNGG